MDLGRWCGATDSPNFGATPGDAGSFTRLRPIVRPDERHLARAILAALLLIAPVLPMSRAHAQVVGAQILYVPGDDTHRAALGGQGEIGFIFSRWNVAFWPSLAIEYQRQDNLGPGRGRLAAELRLLPAFGEHRFHPYLGGSMSANQSGGDQSEWPGTVAGYQAMAGILWVPGDDVPFALLLEERYGYVQHANHATATHIGVMFSFR
jgi:hypothetical protein